MLHKNPKLFIAYRAALRCYLIAVPPPDVSQAGKLGIKALKCGLGTLDLARLHEEVLIDILLTDSPAHHAETIRLAGTFFAEAIMPIEGSNRVAREKNVQFQAAMNELRKRSHELVAKNKELKKEILHRIRTEVALKASEATTSKLLKESLHFQEELRSLSRNHFQMQEEDRKIISRELHDVVAQILTGINIRLTSLALKTHADSSEILKNIAITQRHVEQSVDVVHRFACDLRPTVLDDLGLIPALNAYLIDFTERSGIASKVSAFPTVENISDEEKTVLYRVAQEALVNIMRHSGATHATLTIRKRNNFITMKIRDDGKGFTINAPKSGNNKVRLGLLGMRERVEMVGGKFLLESAPGKGTTIKVKLLIHPSEIDPTKQPPTP